MHWDKLIIGEAECHGTQIQWDSTKQRLLTCPIIVSQYSMNTAATTGHGSHCA